MSGVWLFHCHIEWHVISGLIATFVEDPLSLQKTIEIPKDHLDACAAADMPSKGNAAANTEDFLDLTGQNKPAKSLPSGLVKPPFMLIVLFTDPLLQLHTSRYCRSCFQLHLWNPRCGRCRMVRLFCPD